jgi:hypothetical protein
VPELRGQNLSYVFSQQTPYVNQTLVKLMLLSLRQG